MKIYTAARYARREEILEYAKVLSQAGHIVTARWVNGDEVGKTLEQVAVMDLDDVRAADMVLVFTDPKGSAQTGGGRHTELGLGYALGKKVWLVGEWEQVFHSLPGVQRFDNLDQVLGALKALPSNTGPSPMMKYSKVGLEFADDMKKKAEKFVESWKVVDLNPLN